MENFKSGSSFESGNESPGSMKGTKLHLLIDYHFNKHDRVQFNLFITCVFEKEKKNTQRGLHAMTLLEWNNTMKRKYKGILNEIFCNSFMNTLDGI